MEGMVMYAKAQHACIYANIKIKYNGITRHIYFLEIK